MHLGLCICEALRSIHTHTRTRITILMHVSEAHKPTSTGHLASLVLSNAEVRLRGLPHVATRLDDVATNARRAGAESYRPIVLFPARNAIPLEEARRNIRGAQINLIVPEGTWRQARKVLTREPELTEVPVVRLPANTPPSQYGLRRNVRDSGHLCTLEAIAVALACLGEQAAASALLDALRLMVDRVRRSRGLMVEGVAEKTTAT